MKNHRKLIIRILLALVLLAVPALSAYAAENARQVDTAGGRSIVVQSLNGKAGDAIVMRGGREIPLSKGVRLMEGDSIRTGRDSKVYLAVDASMVLRLEESSEAEIVKAAFDRKLTINLKKGRMFYNVAKQNSGQQSLELMTNNVTIAVRGTSGIISVGNGFVQHQLYDGTVEVYEGETKFIQTPGQMLETRIGPANALSTSTEITGFTLRDIPSSVAQEMLADQNLMERILSSLSLGDLADRVTDILDGTFFKEIIDSSNDRKVFEDTIKTKPDETYSPAPVPTTSETETETETETSTEETSETEPTQPTSPTEPTQPTSPTEPTQPTQPTETSPTETEPTSPTETEPSSEEPSTSEPETTVPSTEESSSEEPLYIHCEFCGKDYPEGDAAEAAKHALGTTYCNNCHSTLHKCVENDPDLLKEHTEIVKGYCEYCKKIPSFDTICQQHKDHCLVECRKCHEQYAKCVGHTCSSQPQ